MAIKMDGHTITALQLKASDGSEVTKQLTEEGTIPTPTEAISITANGTYDVTDKASAVVNVPAPEINLQNKTATANGEVTADEGYDGLGVVTVAVSGDVPTLITKSITANGTYPASADNADGYSSVTVNVPAPVLPTLTNPASASDILSGKEAIDGDGVKLTGACAFDADTSDADAVASDIAEGKTAYVNGAKVVGTASGGASEYWELTGGGNSSSSKQTVNATYHGTEVDKFGTLYDGYWWNVNASFADAITEIKNNAFSNKSQAASGFKLSLSAADNFASLTTLGQECFRGTGLEVVNFPEVTTLTGDAGGQFAQCKFLNSLILPKLTNFTPVNSSSPRAIAYKLNNTVLEEVQIGSVGYGITSFPSGGDIQGATNPNLVITLYCEGTMVDTIKTAMRNSNTTATLVFKASANTTYGGQSFGAGDTILTDAPSA